MILVHMQPVFSALSRIVKPKLMMMDWFAKGWTWFTWLRDKTYGWSKG
jgi:hypothetical protein